MEEIYTIRRRRGWLTVRDAWYRDTPVWDDADVVYYMQMDRPVADDHYEQYTLMTDLRRSEDELFADLGKSCREKVRSIRNRDDVRFEFFDKVDQVLLDRFLSEYNELVQLKSIAPAEVDRLRAYHEKGLLVISRVASADGRTMAWHVYRLNRERAFLIYTVSMWFRFQESAEKNLMGKANRYAHWMDMLAFRERGVETYDWGGWYNGALDEEKLRINRFKEEFGGKVRENYNSIAYLTWKGKIFRLMKKFKRR